MINLYDLHTQPETLNRYGDSTSVPEVMWAGYFGEYFGGHTTLSGARDVYSCNDWAVSDTKRIPSMRDAFATKEYLWMHSAVLSYKYAILTRKRFFAGEPIIASSAECSLAYAQIVIQGEFNRGEPIIATNSDAAFSYACHVLNRRFYLGEPAIQRDRRLWYQYCWRFKLASFGS